MRTLVIAILTWVALISAAEVRKPVRWEEPPAAVATA